MDYKIEIIGPYTPWEPPSEIHNDSQFWYKNGKRNREYGPAVIYSKFAKAWYKDDKYHREDGPAAVHSNGYSQWWYDNKHITNEVTQWAEHCNIDLDNMTDGEKFLLKVFINNIT